MQGIKIARQLELAKKSKTSRFRERFKLSHGRYVMCESRDHWDWWEQFTGALSKGDIKPSEFSIKDLFEALVDDGRELTRLFDPRLGPTNILAEAAGAVASSDFSSITGQILYTMMMQDLKPEDYPFQASIPSQSTQFSGEKIPGIANLGDLAEVVAENEDYPLMGTSEDFIETPETKKRGFIVPITKEAIFFDRTGQLLQKCSKVGDSLMLNKEKRAIDCIVDQNTTAHRYKWRGTVFGTYQTSTPWVNVTGAANVLVDWSDLDVAHQVFNGITDPNTGEPVMVEPTALIVTKENEETARRILNATEIVVHSGGYAVSGNLTETRAPNPFPNKYRILTSNLLATRTTDDQHWWLGAPEKYARYMENWPITVTQAPAGNSDDFNRDIVAKYKCSERGQYAVIEPRVMVENID
jgi:hypothetical protein